MGIPLLNYTKRNTMKKNYYAIFEKGKGEYGAFSPDFPNCIGAGKTLEAAQKNIKEAIEFFLEDSTENPLEPSNLSVIEKIVKNDYNNNNIKIIVGVEIATPSKKYRRVNITLPEDILNEIDTYLKKHDINENRSGFLTKASLEYVSHHK